MLKFSDLHPIVCFSFFFVVILFSAFFIHPILIFISLLSSCIYLTSLKGFYFIIKQLKYYIILFISSAVFNILFNQSGSTVLISIFNFNITLESIFYALMSSINLMSIIIWFLCFNACLNFEIITFFLSKISLTIALLFNSSIRLISTIKQKYNEITYAKSLLSVDTNTLSFKMKIYNTYNNILTLISWSFESSIQTAISIRSRGFELKNKTTYSDYKLNSKDIIISIIMIISVIGTLYSIFKGAYFFEAFPIIICQNKFTYVLYFFYAVTCFLPIITDFYGGILWLKLFKLKT